MCVYVCVVHLVDIKHTALVVEARVQLVKHADDLHGRAVLAHGRESHDVREQHGDIIKLFGLDRKALPESLCHVARENGVEQLDSAPLLLLQCTVRTLQCGLQLVHALLQTILSLRLLAHLHTRITNFKKQKKQKQQLSDVPMVSVVTQQQILHTCTWCVTVMLQVS